MARRAKRTKEELLMRKWWMRIVLALVFLGLAYGFASLAIDSGSLLEYTITVVFVWYAVHQGIRAVRSVFSH